ncbi:MULTISPECIES: polysaccharide pyruvyl transferase family protein [Haloarcula]|uniref:polysaccharide pyruvyl transferase family protein n=1 Tax=Haloarcula TaxID=2237 RepID=UPI000F8DE821|nr:MULTISPECIES: polysaccharide pyruvyl transferase family protein [Haloarcula]NHX38167.1 polysaccharide pyruvyl transferase family protein [Haloarcula sp. R1-2]
MQILLLRTWTTNIGNGFIDKGARSLIDQAASDSDEIIEVSGFPNLVADHKSLGELSGLEGALGAVGSYAAKICRKQSDYTKRIINISEFTDPDIAILPGCVLYRHGIGTYLPVLKRLRERGVPIILLGAGGGDYKEETINNTKELLKDVEIKGLITRDEKAYGFYSDIAEHSYNGIDCAFFINELYNPPKANTTFDMATFDSIDEPQIGDGRRIIRADHNPFEQPHRGLLKKLKFKMDRSVFYNKEDIFVSDNIGDYLFLYKNATHTHSDRIHACVPALAYGGKAKFYYDTPRAALFDRVLSDDIQKSLVSLNKKTIREEKDRQISELKELISS